MRKLLGKLITYKITVTSNKVIYIDIRFLGVFVKGIELKNRNTFAGIYW